MTGYYIKRIQDVFHLPNDTGMQWLTMLYPALEESYVFDESLSPEQKFSILLQSYIGLFEFNSGQRTSLEKMVSRINIFLKDIDTKTGGIKKGYLLNWEKGIIKERHTGGYYIRPLTGYHIRALTHSLGLSDKEAARLLKAAFPGLEKSYFDTYTTPLPIKELLESCIARLEFMEAKEISFDAVAKSIGTTPTAFKRWKTGEETINLEKFAEGIKATFRLEDAYEDFEYIVQKFSPNPIVHDASYRNTTQKEPNNRQT